jgi:uncharacterized integral membrane protein (TIGR00698 family)
MLHPRTSPALDPRAVRAGAVAWLPGLVVVAALTGVAFLVAHLVPGLNPSTVGVLLGAALANTPLYAGALRPGTRAAGHQLLRLAIVLLGLQLSLHQLAHIGLAGLAVVVVTVGITFFGTQAIGRLLRVPQARRLLVATGFSICGASAVAAMEPVADGDRDDTAVAVALVTLCGSLAIVVLPLLRQPLGLDAASFGSWVGASVHDVGQTVATANRVPGALTSAVVVKLTRVALLAPLVAAVALQRRRTLSRAAAESRLDTAADGALDTAADGASGPVKQPPVVPLFVAGFLLAILATSSGLLPGRLLDGAQTAQHVLLTAALVGLGTGIRLEVLRRTGGRALALGLCSWVLVAATAYAGVRLLGH